MKKLVLTLISSLALFACSNNGRVETKVSSQTHNEQQHNHVFRCPMHPEVTGKEGDTCAKCGMKLERSDNAISAAGTYFMEFANTPAIIQPSQPVILSFVPKQKANPDETVPLDVEHEKKIHLILVSDDLSWFDHIHPEYKTDGSYQVPAKFPAPGRYIAFADYKPSGSNHVLDKFEIEVAGKVPNSKTFTSQNLSGTSGIYQATLSPLKPLTSGRENHIWGIISKNGKEIDVNTLEDYLGAKAHIVVIGASNKDYLHVHPSVKNGRLGIHASFDKPGIYRGWIQFNAEGKLHTIDFTMDIVKGPSTADDGDTKSYSGHSH